jgi:hypothetical protein
LKANAHFPRKTKTKDRVIEKSMADYRTIELAHVFADMAEERRLPRAF